MNLFVIDIMQFMSFEFINDNLKMKFIANVWNEIADVIMNCM